MDTPLAGSVGVADGFWLRARGLLGRSRLEEGEGLLLTGCPAIHTVGMRFPIDVAFLDEDGVIMAIYHRLRPNRRTAWHKRAAWALELPEGTLDHTATATGHRLIWEG
jgi:uncharacterized membrane protein (UPF0127 family)